MLLRSNDDIRKKYTLRLRLLHGSHHAMTALHTVAMSCALSLALCQCRAVSACISFLKDHASTGHNARISSNLPPHPMTVGEFVAANSHRRLPPEVLHARFQVADADDNGLLTPEEVESHRIRAARNKQTVQD